MIGFRSRLYGLTGSRQVFIQGYLPRKLIALVEYLSFSFFFATGCSKIFSSLYYHYRKENFLYSWIERSFLYGNGTPGSCTTRARFNIEPCSTVAAYRKFTATVRNERGFLFFFFIFTSFLLETKSCRAAD